MRKLFPVLLFLGVLQSASHAQTDSSPPRFLSWQHSLTTRSSDSKFAVAKLKIFNNWTNGKHRLLVKYNVAGLGKSDDFMGGYYGKAFSIPSFDPSRLKSKAAYHNGTLGLVQNLADDKLIAYSSEAGDKGEYFIEGRKALMKRVRFDPWKKIAPELSKGDVPQLTPQQRARLGREVRSAMRPLLKKVLKTYFRALPNSRVFNAGTEKIEAHGYRMTALMNAGSEYEGAQWLRLNFEWWMAADVPGDAVARQFLGRLIADYRELGGPTTSMWMNETLPMMWASMPQELHQATATLLPVAFSDMAGSTPGGKGALAFGGTPVYASFTISSPKQTYAKCPDCGQYHVRVASTKKFDSLRLELKLEERSMRTLAPVVFDAPREYKKESLEPILKEWDETVEMFQSLYDQETLLSQAPDGREYSWSALKNYTRQANALLLRAQ